MALEVLSHNIGDVIVITCSGRLVETDSSTLARELDARLPFHPKIVLNLAGVTFIDSSGLGFLVRYAMRMRNAGANLRLSALSPKVQDALNVTRITKTFDICETDEEAIQSFAGRSTDPRSAAVSEVDILIVDESPDIQAYLREVCRQAGFGVKTAGNLPDALVLLRTADPRVIVIGATLAAARTSDTGVKFHDIARSKAVVELPSDFSSHDAERAGDRVLEQVRTHLAQR